MYKVIICGLGSHYNASINMFRYYELKGEIEIVGVTSNEEVYDYVDGYKYYKKSQLKSVDFDLYVIASEIHVGEIIQEALELGIDEEKIIRYQVFQLVDFDLEEYIALKKSKPTIFANNCWGGVTYNRLGLKAMSPFVNTSVRDEDYLKFLTNPEYYMSLPLEFVEMGIDPLTGDYPICKLGDVIIHCNHYHEYQIALEYWNRRRERINWDNIFVMMFTSEKTSALEFSKLPYEKKVCFVPFECDEPSVLYVDLFNRLIESRKRAGVENKTTFWRMTATMAKGWWNYYDVIKLLNGNINKDRVIGSLELDK